MLVPPRKGIRIKSKVLPSFNKGSTFQLVSIHTDTIIEYGVLDADRSTATQYFVWKEHALRSVHVPSECIRVINIPHPPQRAIEPFNVTIGGIGSHLRWRVITSRKTYNGPCKLFVNGIVDTGLFEVFVHSKIRPFGFCDFAYTECGESLAAIVCIPSHHDLTQVASAFHCANYAAIPLDDEMASSGNLGIERYDRSEHTWWNQDQKKAGPLRDTHKWNYGFIPNTWRKLPFTWHSLADNIEIDVADIEYLPLPLRNYVCDRMLLATEDPHERDTLLGVRTSQHVVTSRLQLPQNVQILACTYWTRIAPFDKTIVNMCGLLLFRYMIFGYTGRQMGGYKQTAKHIGHGAYCRLFKRQPQYNYENLDTVVKNRVDNRNGVIFGIGFKGTRGKYGHKDFPEYKPISKRIRTVEADVQIREITVNKFDHYSRC